MKHPNLAQWCAIWATAISSLYVWADIPKFRDSHWPYSVYRMKIEDRDRVAIALLLLGLVLVWSVKNIDLAPIRRLLWRVIWPESRSARIWMVVAAALGITLAVLDAVAHLPPDHPDIFDRLKQQAP